MYTIVDVIIFHYSFIIGGSRMIFDGVDFENVARLVLSGGNERGIPIDKYLVEKGPPERLALAVALYFRPDAYRGGTDNAFKYLKKAGMPDAEAYTLISKAKNAVESFSKTPQGKQLTQKRFKHYMIGGSIAFVVGLGVTILTYALSGPGGTFIVGYGGILFGPILFFVGLSGLRKSR
jgi:hypothetical protein